MSMTDPIADLLTRIRNGQGAGKTQIKVASSGVKKAILEVLIAEGYIKGYSSEKEGALETLFVDLKYFAGKPVIETIQRFSKPGCRRYRGQGDLPTVMGGLGVAIVSTSGGVMSDRQAREQGRGGEVLCVVS